MLFYSEIQCNTILSRRSNAKIHKHVSESKISRDQDKTEKFKQRSKKRRKKKQLFTEEDAQTISMFKLHFNSAKNNRFF